MLYKEIIAVCSQIHTKHKNTLCGWKVELLNVNLAVHMVTTELYSVKAHTAFDSCSTRHAVSICTLYSSTLYIYIYIYMQFVLCCVVLCCALQVTHCNVTTAASRLLLNANNRYIVSSERHCQ